MPNLITLTFLALAIPGVALLLLGWRRRQRAASVAGALLVLCCVAWIGLAAWRMSRPGEWIKHKPVSWLLSDAQSADNETASRALAQLVQRLGGKSLSDRQAREVVDTALDVAAQADERRNPYWDVIVQIGWRDGRLSAGQVATYLQQVITIDAQAQPERISQWSLARIELRPRMVGRANLQCQFSFTSTNPTIDGEPVPLQGDTAAPRLRGGLYNERISTSPVFPITMDPGPHELGIACAITATPFPPATPVQWNALVSVKVDVLPAPEGSPELVVSPEANEALVATIECTAIGLRAAPSEPGRPSGPAIMVFASVHDVPFHAAVVLEFHASEMQASGFVEGAIAPGKPYMARAVISPVQDSVTTLTALIDARGPELGRLLTPSPASPTRSVWYGSNVKLPDVHVQWFDTIDDPDFPAQWREQLTLGHRLVDMSPPDESLDPSELFHFE